MSEELENLNLTFKSWDNFNPIRIEATEPLESKSSFFLVEFDSQEQASYGLVGSLSIKNILGGQIHCHEAIFPEKLERIQREFSKELVQKNPIVLIANLDCILNFSPPVTELKCIKSAKTKSKQTLRLFELLAEDIPDLSMIPLCLADGHHRYHAFKNLILSHKDWERASLASVVFPASGVLTSRKRVVFLEDSFSLAPFFHFLQRNSLVEEIHRDSKCEGIKLRFQGRWFEIPIRLVFKKFSQRERFQDCLLFPHQFLLRLLKESKVKIKTPFSLVPEEDLFQLEKDMELNRFEGFILPADNPESVMKIAFEGKILEANSTFFKPKFDNNFITHRMIR